MGNYFPVHDAFATETPGRVHKRENEHLGVSTPASWSRGGNC